MFFKIVLKQFKFKSYSCMKLNFRIKIGAQYAICVRIQTISFNHHNNFRHFSTVDRDFNRLIFVFPLLKWSLVPDIINDFSYFYSVSKFLQKPSSYPFRLDLCTTFF